METIKAIEIIEMLQQLRTALADEVMDPMRCIQGFISTGDPGYLRVHTEKNREIKIKAVRTGPDTILRALMVTALDGK